MIGKGLPDDIRDDLLRGAVRLGHEVDLSRFRLDALEAPVKIHDRGPRLKGRIEKGGATFYEMIG